MKKSEVSCFRIFHSVPSLAAIIKMSCSPDVICWQHKRQKRTPFHYELRTSKSQWWRCQQPRKYKIVTGTSKVIIEKSHNIWHLSWFWAGLEYWKEQFGPIMYFEASSQESTKLLQVHPKPLYIEKSHGAVGDFYEIYLRFGLVLSRLAMLKKIL